MMPKQGHQESAPHPICSVPDWLHSQAGPAHGGKMATRNPSLAAPRGASLILSHYFQQRYQTWLCLVCPESCACSWHQALWPGDKVRQGRLGSPRDQGWGRGNFQRAQGTVGRRRGAGCWADVTLAEIQVWGSCLSAVHPLARSCPQLGQACKRERKGLLGGRLQMNNAGQGRVVPSWGQPTASGEKDWLSTSAHTAPWPWGFSLKLESANSWASQGEGNFTGALWCHYLPILPGPLGSPKLCASDSLLFLERTCLSGKLTQTSGRGQGL